MSKNSKTGGAAAAKPSKGPKRIAGFKVPKDLRKPAAALIEAANSPVGRQVIAAGLAAIVSATATSKTGRKAASDAADATAQTADAGMQQTAQIVDAISTAAGAALQRLFDKKSAG